MDCPPQNTLLFFFLFYSFLHDKSNLEKTKSMLDFERDLTTTFSNNPWSKVLQYTYSTTKFTNIWELSHKITQRWYLTPYRIAKFSSSASPLCWRNCSHVGNIYHILWSCSKLAKFWTRIFAIFCQVTGLAIQPSPSLTLLKIGIEDIPQPLRQYTTHLFLAAKLTILRIWKSPNPRGVNYVIHTLSTHYTYESMLTSVSGKHVEFLNNWQPWLDWYKSYKSI